MKKPLRIVSGVCNSVNPAGCFSNVRRWIEAEKNLSEIEHGPRSVLVLGCSGGYGLAGRISVAFGAGARTFGVSFERAATVRKKATPGWYNNLAFDMASAEEGLFSETLLGDAFSDETREAVIDRGRAYVSVNRALVTRASVVIPIMSAYLCVLNKVLKARGLNENCHNQMARLFRERLYSGEALPAVDEKGRIRLDDFELRDDVQQETAAILSRLKPDNVEELTDWAGCCDELFGLFGFSPSDWGK